MVGREEQLLSASIRDSIAEAHSAFRSLIRERENHGFSEPTPADDWSYAYPEVVLQSWLRKLYRDTAILAERLRLPEFRADIAKARDSNVGKLIGVTDEGDHYCPALSEVESLFESIATITDGAAVTGLSVLQTILWSTRKIVQDQSVQPTKEKDVRDAVFPQLSYAFSDIAREPTIAHPLKCYKPDFGIKSLFALIEYKFARDMPTLGNIVDELLVDMKGYSGNWDWRNFFAVVYTANSFAVQADIDAKLTSVTADSKWRVILV